MRRNVGGTDCQCGGTAERPVRHGAAGGHSLGAPSCVSLCLVVGNGYLVNYDVVVECLYG